MRVEIVGAWRRGWGLTSMARQLAHFLIGEGAEVGVHDFFHHGMRDIDPELDGLVSDDHRPADVAVFLEVGARKGAGAVLDFHEANGAHTIWVPMLEAVYEDVRLYERFSATACPTPLTYRRLTEAGLGNAALLQWSVPPFAGEPVEWPERGPASFLHLVREPTMLSWLQQAWGAEDGSGGPLTLKYGAQPDPPESSGRVEVVAGFLSDAEMDALWARHHILIQPSLYEGVGLPALEAYARGLLPLYLNGSATESMFPFEMLPSYTLPREGELKDILLLKDILIPQTGVISSFAVRGHIPRDWRRIARSGPAWTAKHWEIWKEEWKRLILGVRS